MSTLPIPERNMTDIHMHLIPGVDDGAEDMEMLILYGDTPLITGETLEKLVPATGRVSVYEMTAAEISPTIRYLRQTYQVNESQARRCFPSYSSKITRLFSTR